MGDLTHDVLTARRRNQSLGDSSLTAAETVVASLGAVQAQDYAGAKWALGLRARRLTEARVEAAFDRGAILRTHVLRPTWHFLEAADLRWILALSGPRVHAVNAPYYRANELDPPLMKRSRRVIERALEGGAKTRSELAALLARAGITAAGQRLAYLVMHSELDGVICSGPRSGKQFTYALVEQRVPKGRQLTREESLVELTTRYYRSHGPATLRDFAWWSGLPQRDIKVAIAALGAAMDHVDIDGRLYWHHVDASPSFAPGTKRRSAPFEADALLLPNYDESLIAYRDRQLIDGRRLPGATPFSLFPHQLVVAGRVVGAWQRRDTRTHVEITVSHDGVSCTPSMLDAASNRLAAFLERPTRLVVAPRAG